MDEKKMSDETQQSVSRRGFIKGVIAAGAIGRRTTRTKSKWS